MFTLKGPQRQGLAGREAAGSPPVETGLRDESRRGPLFRVGRHGPCGSLHYHRPTTSALLPSTLIRARRSFRRTDLSGHYFTLLDRAVGGNCRAGLLRTGLAAFYPYATDHLTQRSRVGRNASLPAEGSITAIRAIPLSR